MKNAGKSDKHVVWIIKIIVITLLLSAVFSALSELVMTGASLPAAIVTVVVIILIGVFFDVIGVAVAAADPAAILAMCAKKIRGARQANVLIRNADKVSSICNDVIGDICGIVSGASAGVIDAFLILNAKESVAGLITIAVSSVVATLTVGGKAMCKRFALKNANKIVHAVGYGMSIFSPGKK
ncbi:MAG: hypothetical protein KIG36_05695 [Eubacteriales bacterium]|nr:hypothetical protein [Eubacteriales bacterium]